MTIQRLKELLSEVQDAEASGSLGESTGIFRQKLEDIVDEPINLEIEIVDLLDTAENSRGEKAHPELKAIKKR